MNIFNKESLRRSLLSVAILLAGVCSIATAHELKYEHKHVDNSAEFEELTFGIDGEKPFDNETPIFLGKIDDPINIPLPEVDVAAPDVILSLTPIATESIKVVPVEAVIPSVAVVTTVPVEAPVTSPKGPRKGAIPVALGWIKDRPAVIGGWFNGWSEAYDAKIEEFNNGKKDQPTEG